MNGIAARSLDYLGRGMRFERNELVLDQDRLLKLEARVNGKKCLMVVDTACASTTLDLAFAKDLELTQRSGPSAFTLGGNISTQISRLQSIQCCGLESKNCEALVADLEKLNHTLRS